MKYFSTLTVCFTFFFLLNISHLVAQTSGDWKQTLAFETQNKTFQEIRSLYKKENINPEKALAYTAIALEKTKKENNPKQQFRVYRDIGMIYEDNNKLEDALRSYTQAETIANQFLSDTAKVTIYIDLAITERKNSNYQACKNYYSKVIELSPKNSDSEYLECAYHGIGCLYQSTGDYDKSVEYFLQSLQVAEQRKNTAGMAMSLQYIANSMLSAKNTDRALSNIERAFQLASKADDPKLLGLILKDYGQVLSSEGKLDAALEKYNAALQSFGTEENKPYIVKILMCIADVYTLKGEHTQAAPYLFKCLNEYQSFIFNEDLGNLYLKIGNYYNNRGEKMKAATAYQKGLSICTQYQLKETHISIANALSDIEAQNGHPALALALMKQAKAMENSLFSEERAKHTAELQFKFDVARSDKEIQDLKLRQNNFLIIGLAILLTTITLFFIFWAKMKNKTNQALLQKNFEIELQNRRLEESNDALREFAYASAHDLKEPLRNIGSFITLLQRRFGASFAPEAHEYMDYVNTGVRKMNKLLEDLLKYSTLVVDKQTMSIESARLGEVLEEIKGTLQGTINAKNAQIEYTKALPVLQMSRLHQTQLFQNLISNALKFVEGTPVIKIDCQENDKNTLIRVADNGIGIKTEYSAKVFKLFHRLNRDPQYEGTGVGLSICKNIVEKYNGKIWFESEENQGTTFFIQLPKAA
jgi:signal transduction histidine kinase